MTSTQSSALRLEVLDGSIAQITFDAPDNRANSLGQAVQAQLAQLLTQLTARTDLQGLLFRSGKAGMFSAGADIRELAGAPKDPTLVRAAVEQFLKLIARAEQLPFPTVCLIDGS